MAKQTINQGTAPTGAGGDTFRSGSAKLQANDDELYAQLGATAQGVLPNALPVSKGGTGATTAAAARTNLGLGTAATATLTTSRTESNVGRVIKVGDYGLGSLLHSEILVEGEYDALTGFMGHSASNKDTPFATWGSGGVDGAMAICLKYTSILSYKVMVGRSRMAFRSLFSGVASPWYELKTSANTAIDANGFIKNASPIVQLFADHIELNDEAQQQDITFEKLGEGDYLIKDSSGFAKEGWYIETPKDANGNVLFSVIYTTLENGDISVKTYKKKFDLETASIVADLNNPVDITENRWIDLRLQELPQPEIEIPESIAPHDFQPTGLAEAVAIVMESYNDTEQ